MTTAREGCRASCARRGGGAKAAPTPGAPSSGALRHLLPQAGEGKGSAGVSGGGEEVAVVVRGLPRPCALIRRFAPPSPAGGRRICGEQTAGWRGGRCGGVKLRRPCTPSSGASRHLLPQAGEGKGSAGVSGGGEEVAVVVRGLPRPCALIRRFAQSSPASGRRICRGVGTQAARPVMQRGCHCLLPLAGEGARRADGGRRARPPTMPISYAATPDTPADARWRPSAVVRCVRFRARA